MLQSCREATKRSAQTLWFHCVTGRARGPRRQKQRRFSQCCPLECPVARRDRPAHRWQLCRWRREGLPREGPGGVFSSSTPFSGLQ